MAKFIILLALVGLSLATKPGMVPRQRFGQRIVGGEESPVGEFPHMIDVKNGGSHYCGGSIINEEWVLTAAHCSQSSPSSYTLVAGDHHRGNQEGTEQERNVIQIVVHGNYNPSTIDNDAAMMKVASPFVFNDRVKAVQLPMANSIFDNGDAMAIGWGALSEGGGSPQALQNVTVPLWTNQACQVAYSQYDITPSMICAGVAGKDSCQGDSGGPMICQENGQWVHCGIVSWGIGCAREGYPGVYGRTSFFLQFIRDTLDGIVPPCNGFECIDGSCIPPHWECDGYHDCDFGEDEHDECPPCNGYECNDGSCIPPHWECDDWVDCPDGEDEWDCGRKVMNKKTPNAENFLNYLKYRSVKWNAKKLVNKA
jgi:secreted trypsin-like serine protease